jgi:hypothetical protein
MSGYSSDFWLALCASLTGLGLVLTVLLGRRRSVRSMLHGAAWSLIPIAAYLTGSTLMFWRIGVAIGAWASAFVFSTQRWAGIAVTGLIVVLFLIGGGRLRRRQAREKRRQARERTQATGGAAGAPGAIGAARTPGAQGLDGVGRQSWEQAPAREPEPARPAARKDDSRPKAAPPKDNRQQSAPAGKSADTAPAGLGDMAEIEEILRKRGIN